MAPPLNFSRLLSLSWLDFSRLVGSTFPRPLPSLTSSLSDPIHSSSVFAGASAAVTLVFFPKVHPSSSSSSFSPHLLMLKKKPRGRHGGQIAFPGGLVENGSDSSLWHTAQRELEEEVGLVLRTREEESVGCLPTLFTTDTTHLSAACFIATHQPQQQTRWVLDEDEIDVAMEVPLPELLDSYSLYHFVSLCEGGDVELKAPPLQKEVYTLRGSAENMPPTYTGPVFSIPNDYGLYPGRPKEVPVIIWGLTARMLYECLHSLTLSLQQQ